MIKTLPGVYHERIAIRRDDIWLAGTGAAPADVVLTYGDSAKNTGSTFKSGTVIVDADGFAAENLTIANTWWDEHPDPTDGSQAVALQLTSDRAVLDRVRLLSGKDTLYSGSRTCRSSSDTGPCQASRQYFHSIASVPRKPKSASGYNKHPPIHEPEPFAENQIFARKEFVPTLPPFVLNKVQLDPGLAKKRGSETAHSWYGCPTTACCIASASMRELGRAISGKPVQRTNSDN